MLKELLTAILIFLSVSATAQYDTTKLYYHYSLKKIKRGIYVSVRTEPLRQYVEGNFVLIESDTGVLVVDATGSPTAARWVLSDINRIFKKPVTHLVNTHYHGDHTFGNQAFKNAFPDITIIQAPQTAAMMRERVKTFKAFTENDSLFKARIKEANESIEQVKGSRFNDPRIVENYLRFRDLDLHTVRMTLKEVIMVPATKEVGDSLSIRMSKRSELKVLYLGKGDTPGDLWVFLPQEKILIAGDAVVHPVPYGYTRTPSEWLTTLKRARELDFDTLIPGHGDVQKGKVYLNKLIGALESIRERVYSAREAGKSYEQVKSEIKLSDIELDFCGHDRYLQYYFNDYFLAPIVQRFFDEK